MKSAASTDTPTILFGAFDRHNLGDLLFPHIMAALLPDTNLIYAGLAERDLRQHGGHRVRALAALTAELGDSTVNLIHVGGELLTCDAWQAAVMLSPSEQAPGIIAQFDAKPAERLEWAHKQLGIFTLAPYTVSRELFPHAAKLIYNAIGGVGLEMRDPALRAEVMEKLSSADWISVRDSQTLGQLGAAGIVAHLVPDPAVMVAELFGTQIRQHGRQGELAEIQHAFPQGYLAVQFSADFGDDETLSEIAAQLDRISASSGYAVVLFRAGAAPWHDDLDCYQRLTSRMDSMARIFRSLNLWDICALIARSRAYCGSSLHGRIVAGAFALPHLTLLHPNQTSRLTKQGAYADTWNSPCKPATAGIHDLAESLRQVLATESELLRATAQELAARYSKEFESIRSEISARPGTP